MSNDSTRLGLLCALAAALIWSGFILVSRVGGISELTPYDIIAIRYVTCSAILLPIWLYFYRFNLLSWRYVITALIGGLAYAIFTFKGFKLSSALHGGILLPGLIPVFVAITSRILVGAKLSGSKALGLGLIVTAITALFISEVLKAGSLPLGDVYFVMAAFCWGLYSVIINKWAISPWQATCSLAFITSIIYLPLYVAFLPKNILNADMSDVVLQMFYQGFLASIIQMLLYVKAVKIIGAQGMGSFMALVPVLAGLFGIVILNEPYTEFLWLALVLVSLGVWISNRGLSVAMAKSG
jgi:drug/metabolite transporter (DMT)-like permease